MFSILVQFTAQDSEGGILLLSETSLEGATVHPHFPRKNCGQMRAKGGGEGYKQCIKDGPRPAQQVALWDWGRDV